MPDRERLLATMLSGDLYAQTDQIAYDLGLTKASYLSASARLYSTALRNDFNPIDTALISDGRLVPILDVCDIDSEPNTSGAMHQVYASRMPQVTVERIRQDAQSGYISMKAHLRRCLRFSNFIVLETGTVERETEFYHRNSKYTMLW